MNGQQCASTLRIYKIIGSLRCSRIRILLLDLWMGVGIRNAVTNKNNKSGTSGIINLNDVCNWRFVKKV